MNKTFYYFCLLLILCIILIKIYHISKNNKEGFKEGLNIGKEIKKGLLSAFKPFISRMQNIGFGLKNGLHGLGVEIQYLGIGTARGVADISLLFAYISQFVFSYTMCGVKYMSNVPSCLLYYSVDTTFKVLHLPIRISLWVLQSSIGINLYPIQDKLWKWLLKLNGYIYGSLGFNIIRWPKNVRDQCYNCKRLKLSVLARKGKDIDYDLRVNLPKVLTKGMPLLARADKQLQNAFSERGRR